MDDVIKDLGGTFLVGAFAVLGFEFVVYRLLGVSPSGLFRGHSDGAEALRSQATDVHDGMPALKVAAFFAVAFATGIVAEGVSGKFADGGSIPFAPDVKSALRMHVLVSPKSDSWLPEELRAAHLDPKDSYAPTPLGQDLARTQAFVRFGGGGATASRVQQWFAETPSDAAVRANRAWLRETRGVADRLYYQAKNTIYKEESYYDELRRLQARIDFSRTVALLAAVHLLGALVLFGGGWGIRGLRRALAEPSHPATPSGTGGPSEASHPSVTGSSSEGGQAADAVHTMIPGEGGTVTAPAHPASKTLRQQASNAISPGEPLEKVLAYKIFGQPKKRLRPADFTVLLAVFSTIVLMTAYAFLRESIEFNKRAYGYFSSQLIADADAPFRGQEPLPSEPARAPVDGQKAPRVTAPGRPIATPSS